jgi:1-acyl-sn-glycerol-3-phosphate acyltransferase
MAAFQKLIKPVRDFFITVFLWLYFIVGYLVLFAPLFILAAIFSGSREHAFQRLLHLYCRSFFRVLRLLIPRLSIQVQPDVRLLRSAVVVCNHVSYLDPLLLVAIFKKHKTIVKSTFFKVPIFGWVLKASGYIYSSASGADFKPVLDRIENLGDYLSSGGILFIFPEGTRSRDGRIGRLHTGAFKIANRFDTPINVLVIRNTQHLFRPGKFLFNTDGRHAVQVEWLGRIAPAAAGRRAAPVPDQMQQVRTLLENRLNADFKQDG